METSVLILIAAVVVSLAIGVTNIIQTKLIQKRQYEHIEEVTKKEHKQRLLNEIIEWALDVTKCGKKTRIEEMDIKKELSSFLGSAMLEMSIALGLMQTRNEYINAITSSFFRQDLQNDVDALIDSLESYCTFLSEESTGISDVSATVERLTSYDKQLITSANRVVKKACEIKALVLLDT